MTLFFDSLKESQLGYAAVFACIGLGFLFLRMSFGKGAGPGYWTASFSLSGLGFLFWSGIIPLPPLAYYLIGETFHVAGFFCLVNGAYRFTGKAPRTRHIVLAACWILVWAASILLAKVSPFHSSLSLKSLRALLFAWAGIVILRDVPREAILGRRLAGWSLIAWAAYLMIFAFLRLETMLNLAYGFLVGLQVLAAFGMVVMAIDRIRIRAEESERLATRLEGLLPICCYCKKIRDEGDEWQVLEAYIEDHSTAEFSHGICPDCMKKHHPGTT